MYTDTHTLSRTFAHLFPCMYLSSNPLFLSAFSPSHNFNEVIVFMVECERVSSLSMILRYYEPGKCQWRSYTVTKNTCSHILACHRLPAYRCNTIFKLASQCRCITHEPIWMWRKFNDVHELFASIKFSSVLKEEYELGIMESNENAIKQMSAPRIKRNKQIVNYMYMQLYDELTKWISFLFHLENSLMTW